MITLESIEKKLQDSFSPTSLELTDESHKHIGHGGWQEGQISHLHIKIVSSEFLGKSQVTIHKMIYKALDYELKNGLHALSINT